MPRYPVKTKSRIPAVIDADPVEAPLPAAVQRRFSSPFTSFSYSFTEVSVSGGKATVRSRSTKLENGKLTSESFEGETDRSTCDGLLETAQRQFMAETALMFDSVAAFLPGWKRRSGRD